MKIKLLFVWVFSISAVVSSAQVIFDPATYPKDSLPAGMTLDTLDGRVYVQVILNGWNSYIKIDPTVVINEKSTHFRVIARYGSGVSGFELSKINTFLKLVTPDYTELAAAASASSDSQAYYQVKIAKTDTVGYIQVAGQETVNWTAVTGDTLWLGKVMAVEVDPQAIFDPGACDPDLLAEGMSIVEMDGLKYLQVILNGHDSNFETFPFTIGSGVTHIRTRTKYGGGVSGFALAKIGIGIYFYNANHDIIVDASLSSVAKPDLTVYKAPVKQGITGRMEVYAVGKPNFTPIVGDTLWVGKVRTTTYEQGVVFDPAQYDPVELPAGMEIVSLGGTKYLKAQLNGWNSAFSVDPINETIAHTHFSTNVKYAVGTSGFPLNKINTFLKVATADWTELGAAGSASSAEFKKYSVALPTKGMIANFQIAGQETTNWSAVTGDTLWIGKTILEDMAAPTDPANLSAAVVDTATVRLTWDVSTDNQYVKGYVIYQDDVVIDTVTSNLFEVTGLANGTYNFKVVALDGSGNLSGAGSTDVTLGPTSVHSQMAEKLKIYPNPVTSTLWVKGVQDIHDMTILNITGTTVMTVHNTNQVDVSDLREGLYVIRVKTPSGMYSATFIKK
jgi:hypothetical protein